MTKVQNEKETFCFDQLSVVDNICGKCFNPIIVNFKLSNTFYLKAIQNLAALKNA